MMTVIYIDINDDKLMMRDIKMTDCLCYPPGWSEISESSPVHIWEVVVAGARELWDSLASTPSSLLEVVTVPVSQTACCVVPCDSVWWWELVLSVMWRQEKCEAAAVWSGTELAGCRLESGQWTADSFPPPATQSTATARPACPCTPANMRI